MEETVNQRIKKLREHLKLSQREFAQKLDMSPSAIFLIEKNERRPQSKTTNAIIRVFGISPDWLNSGAGEMYSGVRLIQYEAKEPALKNDLIKLYQDALYSQLKEDNTKLSKQVDTLMAMLNKFLTPEEKKGSFLKVLERASVSARYKDELGTVSRTMAVV